MCTDCCGTGIPLCCLSLSLSLSLTGMQKQERTNEPVYVTKYQRILSMQMSITTTASMIVLFDSSVRLTCPFSGCFDASTLEVGTFHYPPCTFASVRVFKHSLFLSLSPDALFLLLNVQPPELCGLM